MEEDDKNREGDEQSIADNNKIGKKARRPSETFQYHNHQIKKCDLNRTFTTRV